MNGPISYPNHPRLGIGETFVKVSDRRHRIDGQLKSPGFNIDRHNFSVISLLDLGPNLGLIELIAPSGEFFFAISGGSNCHRLDLYSLCSSGLLPFRRKPVS
jgi:hypothetical protein